jgi:hypothetical protein
MPTRQRRRCLAYYGKESLVGCRETIFHSLGERALQCYTTVSMVSMQLCDTHRHHTKCTADKTLFLARFKICHVTVLPSLM